MFFLQLLRFSAWTGPSVGSQDKYYFLSCQYLEYKQQYQVKDTGSVSKFLIQHMVSLNTNGTITYRGSNFYHLSEVNYR